MDESISDLHLYQDLSGYLVDVPLTPVICCFCLSFTESFTSGTRTLLPRLNKLKDPKITFVAFLLFTAYLEGKNVVYLVFCFFS